MPEPQSPPARRHSCLVKGLLVLVILAIIVGGRRLKARARFLVSNTPGRAALVLDDVTIWGVSLPNDWLGGLKGRDLLTGMLGTKGGGVAGVEEFRIEPGRLLIRLSE